MLLNTKLLQAIQPDDFQYFKGVIRELSGIALSDAKKELLQSRLRSRIISLGLESFSDYRNYLEGISEDHSEWQVFINLLTTNKTDWFREAAHFDYLVNEFLPQWLEGNKRKLSVWSSASSTGEEPYTTAIVLERALSGHNQSFEILATDVDTEVLNIARNGVYQKARLEQVPEQYRSSSFAFGTADISQWMKVKSSLKERVLFQQFNLTDSHCPWKSKFDVIFCRNVLIYFPKEVIAKVIETLYQAAAPGAVLFIGHSESLQGIPVSWTYVRPSIFIKQGQK